MFEDGETLVRPPRARSPPRIGLHTAAELPFYDLVILGGGPAGLAAAVYGASEGLRTLLVERDAAGGQAGQSSRIENYLGFPSGVSGADLARRATAQALRLGAEMLPREVVSASGARAGAGRRLDGGEEIGAHAVVVATGVHYPRLEAPGVEELTGSGVYYGASPAEAVSSGARTSWWWGRRTRPGRRRSTSPAGRRVTILYRGEDLDKSMSRYLIDRIDALPNIEVRCARGSRPAEGHLEELDA